MYSITRSLAPYYTVLCSLLHSVTFPITLRYVPYYIVLCSLLHIDGNLIMLFAASAT